VYSESLFGAYRFGWTRVRSVTDGRYRLVRGEQDELYDLATDRAGQHDIAAERPTEVNRLGAVLDQIAANDTVTEPALRAPAPEQLAVLGYVGTPDQMGVGGATSIDPRQQIDLVETYRTAFARAREGALGDAIQVLDGLVRRHPDIAAAWRQLGDFAAEAGRMERAVEAYRRSVALRPGATGDRLAMSRALLRLRRLDDAASQAELALAAAVDDRTAQADAQEQLARIALLRRDSATARAHAALARQAEPTLPAPAFVEGRLFYDASQLEKALEAFQSAIAEIDKTGAPPMADLHYYAGDTLMRLERPAEAEYHLQQELRAFPQHVRARGGLAALYHETGRTEEAGEVLEAMLRVSQTPEAYSLAARLWTSFGSPSQAAAVRAEAARASTGRRTAPTQ
jgi:tetratricopeptide (TPR) repeat protein